MSSRKTTEEAFLLGMRRCTMSDTLLKPPVGNITSIKIVSKGTDDTNCITIDNTIHAGSMFVILISYVIIKNTIQVHLQYPVTDHFEAMF